MTSTRLSLIVMLLASVNSARNESSGRCAEVRTASRVVALESSVSASCTIREDCPFPIAASVPIQWRVDENVFSVANQSGRISHLFIPSFNVTTATLTCSVMTEPPQVVGGVKIRAGNLPSVPYNLQCQTNLTTPKEKMLCSWDPGEDSHLHTNYSLHTYQRSAHIRSEPNKSYEVPPGHHHFIIVRPGFHLFIEMSVYVKAVNELGESRSEPVVLEPLSVAKFEPPVILKITANKSGCLRIIWKLSEHESWFGNIMNTEVKAKVSEQWEDQHLINKDARPSKPVDLCRLLPGTRYETQMRVRYRQSPWSEWSGSHSRVTLESAPTGRLDSWMKVSGDHRSKQVSVDLFWKPSKQFRANGQNVSYVVSRTRLPGERGQLCATTGRFCSFQAPARAKVFLSARNAAGRTAPIELRVYPSKGFTTITQMTVTPYDNTSLLVQWTSGNCTSLLGFVVEWRPLLQTDLAFVQFQSTNKTQTNLIISGGIEPYEPYGISVYPRFKDGTGLPQTANAFSRQKAPSIVPKLRQNDKNSWSSDVELMWDELPLDQRNGIIQGYEVHYREENGPFHVVYANPDKRTVLLKNLTPRSMYEAFLVVKTFGGSLNGTSIHFKTQSADMASLLITISVCMALICMVIFFHHTSHRESLRKHFWPSIPDPANSSIKKWSTESSEEILPPFSSREPSLLYLSHLSFLDLPSKVQKEEEDDRWLNSVEDTSDLGESICGSPTLPGYCGSHSGSVPYATVVFSTSTSPGTSPCNSPGPRETLAYLRSESTQPLLEPEETFTPKCYQNVPTEKAKDEQCFFGPGENGVVEEEPAMDITWDEFPFLSALEVNDAEND